VQPPKVSSLTDGSLAVVLSHDHSFIKLMHVVLEELGLEPYVDEIRAGNVHTLARLAPRLVVLDVRIGHEHLAWEMVVALRSHARTRQIPIIVCAAAPWVLEKQSPFLTRYSISTWSKPFDPADLVRTLHTALSST
jgi:CheY-like chemotaxis protein